MKKASTKPSEKNDSKQNSDVSNALDRLLVRPPIEEVFVRFANKCYVFCLQSIFLNTFLCHCDLQICATTWSPDVRCKRRGNK